MNKFLLRVLTLFFSVLVAFPVLYSLSLSFFSPVDFTDTTAHLLPSSLSLGNYALALMNKWFGRYLLNSFLTAALTTLSRLAVTVLAAFSFSHLRFKGERALLVILLSTMFVPSEALLYENYILTARLGLLDTYCGIILPSVFAASALLLLLGSFLALDKEYYEAAKVDGASDMRYILSVLMPLTGSVTLTVALQTFITSFNSYLWPLLVTSKTRMRTVQVGIGMLGFQENAQYGAQFAALVLITLPFLALLLLGKDLIDKTLTGDIHS